MAWCHPILTVTSSQNPSPEHLNMSVAVCKAGSRKSMTKKNAYFLCHTVSKPNLKSKVHVKFVDRHYTEVKSKNTMTKTLFLCHGILQFSFRKSFGESEPEYNNKLSKTKIGTLRVKEDFQIPVSQ